MDEESLEHLRDSMSPRKFKRLEFLRYLYQTEDRGGL